MEQKKDEELPANYPVRNEGIIRKFDLLEEGELVEKAVNEAELADRRKEAFMEQLRLNYPEVYKALKAEEDGEKEII